MPKRMTSKLNAHGKRNSFPLGDGSTPTDGYTHTAATARHDPSDYTVPKKVSNVCPKNVNNGTNGKTHQQKKSQHAGTEHDLK